MKTHWLLGTVALVAALLACSNPFQPEPRYTATTIKSVGVAPTSGSGSFTLEVSYETFWIPDKFIPNIYCNYVAPNGAIVPIGTIDMLYHIGAREIVTATKTLPFTVAQTNGVTQPGTYLAGCTTETNSTPVTTTFVVIGDATPTPEPPSETAATPTATLQTAALKGQIVFDFANAQSSKGPGWGGLLDEVTRECKPELTISALGVVSGSCDKAHISARLVDESFTVQVTGTVDADRNIIFSYDVSEIGTPNGAWRITYEGQGRFASATQAAGTASFSYSCSSGADNLLWCSSQAYEAISGTISWIFVPSP